MTKSYRDTHENLVLNITFRIKPTRESRLLIFSTTRGSNTNGRASKCSDPHEEGAAAVEGEEECDDEEEEEEEDLGGCVVVGKKGRGGNPLLLPPPPPPMLRPTAPPRVRLSRKKTGSSSEDGEHVKGEELTVTMDAAAAAAADAWQACRSSNTRTGKPCFLLIILLRGARQRRPWAKA